MIEALVLKETEAGVVATNDPDVVGFDTELLMALVVSPVSSGAVQLSKDNEVLTLTLADEVRRYRITKVDGPITVASRIRD